MTTLIIRGPQGNAGLTGRMIVIDTYGGWGAHGDGAIAAWIPRRCLRPVTGGGATDWHIAAAVTGGVTEFLMTGPINSSDDSSSRCMTLQEKLFKMLYIDLGSCIISSFTLIASGRLVMR